MINGTEDNERFFNHYKIRKKRKMQMRGTWTKRKKKITKATATWDNSRELLRFKTFSQDWQFFFLILMFSTSGVITFKFNFYKNFQRGALKWICSPHLLLQVWKKVRDPTWSDVQKYRKELNLLCFEMNTITNECSG